MYLYCTGPVQHILTAGWDLDDLDRDLSVRHVVYTLLNLPLELCWKGRQKKACMRPHRTWSSRLNQKGARQEFVAGECRSQWRLATFSSSHRGPCEACCLRVLRKVYELCDLCACEPPEHEDSTREPGWTVTREERYRTVVRITYLGGAANGMLRRPTPAVPLPPKS